MFTVISVEMVSAMNTKIVKDKTSYLLSQLGIHSFFEQQLYFNSKALILMYHRILTSSDETPVFIQNGMYVTKKTFEQHINYLKTRFTIVFIEELVKKINNGQNLGGLCAITFDDGWADNYTNAFPVLLKENVPATIFLATNYLGTHDLFWPEEITSYFDNCAFPMSGCSQDAPEALTLFARKVAKFQKRPRCEFLEICIETLKRSTPAVREEINGYFRRREGKLTTPRQMLTWEEAQVMQASGLIRFGAHTRSHEILDQLSPDDAEIEISGSRDEIASRLGVEVNTFAYPNGSHNEEIRRILRKEGFLGAVTTRKGFVQPDTSPFEIPRIGVHQDVSASIPSFRSRMLFRMF